MEIPAHLTVEIPVHLNSMDLPDPVTPCKRKHETCFAVAHFDETDFDTPEKLSLVERQRGRPRGSATIAELAKRGKAGGFLSNRRMKGQPPIQRTWSSIALVPVVKYMKEGIRYVDGKFACGSLARVKTQFPRMALTDGVIKRCFHKGDQLLEDAKLLCILSKGNHERASRRRQGLRSVTSQGQRPSCLGPLYATGLWHYEMRCLQLQVPEAALVAYFLDELDLHKEVLTSVLEATPDAISRTAWQSELNAISRTICRFGNATASKRSKAVQELKKRLQVHGFHYCVTVLSPSAQHFRKKRKLKNL